MNRRGIGILTVVVVLLAVGLAWVWHGYSLDPVTDPQKYPAVLGELAAKGWTSAGHFPKVIPPSATHVSFFYQPGLWQGAEQIQLRYMLPAAEFQATVQNIPPATTRPVVAEYPRFRRLPGTFSVVSLVAMADEAGNHGHAHGVAVSPSSQEVVYFAEEW